MPDRMQQIVWNLMTNAIKFTSRDGVVKVALHIVDDCAEIDVEDDGQSIAARLLPHIFERFLQGDSCRPAGTVAWDWVSRSSRTSLRCRGSVTVSSAGFGRGATSRSLLLRRSAREHAPAPADQTPRSRPLLADVVVMVVDDEADARDLVQRFLEDAGARVSRPATPRKRRCRRFRMGSCPT